MGDGGGNPAVALSSLPAGAKARLASVDAGAGLRARLVAMGLRPGVPVTVVHNRGRGPFLVAVQGTRIMLGRGMAEKVLVWPLAECAAAGGKPADPSPEEPL
jgi:Fur family ferric uptake transcriptional regulator